MYKTLKCVLLLFNTSSFLSSSQSISEHKDLIEQVNSNISISDRIFADAEAHISSFEPFSIEACDEFEKFMRNKSICHFLRINYEPESGFYTVNSLGSTHPWVSRFQRDFIPYLNTTGFIFNKNFSFFIPLEDKGIFPEIESFLNKIPLCCPDRPVEGISKWIIIPDHYVQQKSYADMLILIKNERDKFPFFEREDRLGFRGSQTGPNSAHYDADSFGNLPRLNLVMLSHTHPDDVDARFLNYDCQLKPTEKGQQYKRFMLENFGPAPSYTPFHQMVKYRYNASLDGNVGAWQRPHQIMFTGSVPFFHYVYANYFTPYLQENVHYVAIKPDMSDVIEKINSLRTNPRLALSIVQNAIDFAEEVLTPKFIKTYMRFLLEKIAAQFCEDFSTSEILNNQNIEQLHLEQNVDIESLGVQILLGEKDDLIYTNLLWHYRMGIKYFEILHQGLSKNQAKKIKIFYDRAIDSCSLNVIPAQERDSAFISTLPRSLKSIRHITDKQILVSTKE